MDFYSNELNVANYQDKISLSIVSRNIKWIEFFMQTGEIVEFFDTIEEVKNNLQNCSIN